MGEESKGSRIGRQRSWTSQYDLSQPYDPTQSSEADMGLENWPVHSLVMSWPWEGSMALEALFSFNNSQRATARRVRPSVFKWDLSGLCDIHYSTLLRNGKASL